MVERDQLFRDVAKRGDFVMLPRPWVQKLGVTSATVLVYLIQHHKALSYAKVCGNEKFWVSLGCLSKQLGMTEEKLVKVCQNLRKKCGVNFETEGKRTIVAPNYKRLLNLHLSWYDEYKSKGAK